MKTNILIEPVTLGDLSQYQKPDCLFCNNIAIQEARFGIAHIRCCDNLICIRRAKDLAILLGNT
ncbi:hypothetical protein LDC_0864 [sediment metagenome]|uniref:Uncharacterized protein n=1 Tax=sediment metagenome TaxID=749907 RepID=D9PH64_9ZZZZ